MDLKWVCFASGRVCVTFHLAPVPYHLSPVICHLLLVTNANSHSHRPSPMCLTPFYLTLELSLLLGPVHNQNLPSRGPKCVPHFPHSASLALCKQENTLDIALNTLLRSEQAPGCVFHPRDENTKIYRPFWGHSWCNTKIDPVIFFCPTSH